MENNTNRPNNMVNQRKRRHRIAGIATILSALVIFVTAYLLMEPATTLEHLPTCGLEEHVHTEDCYLICGKEASPLIAEGLDCPFVPHVHTESCYDSEGNLACGYADYAFHVHNDLCYALTDSETENSGESTRSLVCTLPERTHVHTDACIEETSTLTCGKIEDENHVHTDACGHIEHITCGLEESDSHHHDASCITVEYLCGLEAGETHHHSDNCYTTERTYICGYPEVLDHVHTADCFDENGHAICGYIQILRHEHNENCFTNVTSGHVHTAECYATEPKCGLTEHVHTDACFQNDPAGWEEYLAKKAAEKNASDASASDSTLGTDESNESDSSNHETDTEPEETEVPETESIISTGDTTAVVTAANGDLLPLTVTANVQKITEGELYSEINSKLADIYNTNELPEEVSTAIYDINIDHSTYEGVFHVEVNVDPALEGDSFKVYHIGETAELLDAAYAGVSVKDGSAVSFWVESDSFSPFVLVASKEVASYEDITVELEMTEGENLSVSEALKNAEIDGTVKSIVSLDEEAVTVSQNDNEAEWVLTAVKASERTTVEIELEEGGKVLFNITISEAEKQDIPGSVSAEMVDEQTVSIAQILQDNNIDAQIVSIQASDESIINIEETGTADTDYLVSAADGFKNTELNVTLDTDDTVAISLDYYVTSIDGSKERDSVNIKSTSASLMPGDSTVVIENKTGEDKEELISKVEDHVNSLTTVPVIRKAKAQPANTEVIVDNGDEIVITDTVSDYAIYGISVLSENIEYDDLGRVHVTVQPDSLNLAENLPEDATITSIKYSLYHIHDDAVNEIRGVSVTENNGIVEEFAFVTNNFSEFVLKYTVEYSVTLSEGDETITYTLSPNETISVTEILEKLGKNIQDNKIESVEITKGENVTLEVVEGEWIITNQTSEANEISFVLKYTNDSPVTAQNLEINLNFTGFVPGDDGVFVYDTEKQCLEAAFDTVLTSVAEGENVISAEGDPSAFLNLSYNLAVASENIGFESGVLRIAGDGYVVLESGDKTVEIKVEGLELVVDRILEAGGIRVEGKAPVGAEVKFEEKSESETSELVAKFGIEGEEYKGFEVSIEKDGEEYASEGGYKVEVEGILPEGAQDVRLFHIHGEDMEEVEKVEVKGTSMSFETENFSDFVVSYTVDFEYDGKQYSIPGESSILLSQLLKELDITLNNEDITNVTFTDYRLLTVSETGNDWLLTSKHSFQSDEVLTLYIADGTILEIKVTDAIHDNHADLVDLLTSVSVSIDGQQNNGANWEVQKGQKYEVTLNYEEVPNTGLQLDTNGNLTYKLPDEFNATSMTEEIVLSYTDTEGHTQTLTGNTFTVDASTNTVKLNLTDDAKAKIESSGKASFQIKLWGSFEKDASGVEWSDSTKRNIIVDDTHDLSVEKSGSLDANNDVINYTVKVKSTGYNENVKIEDIITGTALTLNPDSIYVGKTSWSTGDNSTTPSITTDGNKLTVNFPSLNNQEEVYVRYQAKVDRTKLTGNATKAETSNGVKVSGDGVEDKTDSTDFENQIEVKSLSKSAGNYFGDGEKKTLPWTIVYNAARGSSVAGKTVTDTIAENSRSIMKYSGTGITVTKYKKNADGWDEQEGEAVQYTWDQLTHSDSFWTWTVPSEDTTPYKYVITYETEVNVGTSTTNTTVKNDVTESGGGSATGTGTAGPGFDLNLQKSGVNNNNETATWTITFDVPETGLDKAVVTDYLPKFGEYIDILEGNVSVSGIVSEETWSIDNSSAEKVIITFFNDGNEGLKGTGTKSTISVTLTTKFNENWMEQHPAGTSNSEHTNTVNLNGTVQKYATLIPVKPEIVKSGSYAGSVDGLPYYKYTIQLRGYDGSIDLTVTDTYDKDLEYYSFRINGQETWKTGSIPDFINGYWDEVLYASNSNRDGAIFPVITETVGESTNSFTFTIDKGNTKLKKTDDSYYESYTFVYYLKVKDQAALADLTSRSVTSNGVIKLTNNVTWSGSTGGDSVDIDYEYQAVKKTLLNADQIADKVVADDNVYAKYEVVLNEGKQKLNGGFTADGSTDMEMTDTFTNLSVNYSSVEVTTDPAGRESQVKYNYKGSTGTFIIPDETKVTIRYEARVTVADLRVQTSFGNTAKLKGFKDSTSHKTTAGGSATGTIPEYAIRIFKYDGKDMRTGIGGAVYVLTDAKGNPILYPSTAKAGDYYDEDGVLHTNDTRAGKPITFVTKANQDGKSIYTELKLHQTDDGISLQPGIQYHFKETHAPDGYQLSNINYAFTISTNPNYDNWEYYSGDIIKITDEKKKGVLEIDKNVVITDTKNNTTQDAGNQMTAAQKESIVFTIEMIDESGNVVLKDGVKAYSKTLTYAEFSNGKYRFEDLEPGKYKVSETNYNLVDLNYTSTETENGNNISAEISDRTFVFTVSEDETTGTEHVVKYTNKYNEADQKIVIKKVNEDGSIGLYGAQFRVEFKETESGEYAVLTGNSAVDDNGIFEIPYAAKDTGVTIRSLKNGYYKVTEVKSPEGYRIVGDGVFEFSIENGAVKGATSSSVEYTAENGTNPASYVVKNGITYGYTFTKHEKGSVSDKLKGAEFTTYEYDATKNSWELDPIKTYVTDENGNFEILFDDSGSYKKSNSTEKHLYFVQETKAPAGYQTTDAKYFFYWPESDEYKMEDTYITGAGSTVDATKRLGAAQEYELVPNNPTPKDLEVRHRWKTQSDGWIDPNDIPVEYIEFELYQTATIEGVVGEAIRYPDDSKVYRIERAADASEWYMQIKGLPIGSSKNGQVITYAYSVKEINIPEGFISTEEVDNAGNSVIYNRPIPTSITIKKEWYIPSDVTVTKPNNVTITLMRRLKGTSEAFTSSGINAVLSESNDWTVTYDDLDADYEYSLNETVPTGWTVGYSNEDGIESGTLTATNYYTTQVNNDKIAVKKVWVDSEGNETSEIPEDANVSFKIVKQERTYTDGVKITVTPKAKSGATGKPVSAWVIPEKEYSIVMEGFNGENTKVSVNGETFDGHKWISIGPFTAPQTNASYDLVVTETDEDKFNNIPSISISIPWGNDAKNLMYGEKEEFKSVTLNAGNNWSAEYETDSDYVYSIDTSSLSEPAGYEVSYANNNGITTGTIFIRNKEKAGSYTVEKKWLNADGSTTWPDGKTVTVTLLKDGVKVEKPADAGNDWINPVTLSASQQTYRWDKLEEGNYTVEEATVEGYETFISASGKKATITNYAPNTDVPVLKTWNIGEAEPTDAVITVGLKSRERVIGGEYGEFAAVMDGSSQKMITIQYDSTKDSGLEWSGSFGSLPKYRADGETLYEIDYTAEELSVMVNGVDVKSQYTPSVEGTHITNSSFATTEFTVDKKWFEGTNEVSKNGSITFDLYRTTQTIEASGSDNTSEITITFENNDKPQNASSAKASIGDVLKFKICVDSNDRNTTTDWQGNVLNEFNGSVGDNNNNTYNSNNSWQYYYVGTEQEFAIPVIEGLDTLWFGNQGKVFFEFVGIEKGNNATVITHSDLDSIAPKTYVGTYTISSENGWTTTVSNLQKYVPGTTTEWTYFAVERIPIGYEDTYMKDENGNWTIKNTKDDESTGSIKLTKTVQLNGVDSSDSLLDGTYTFTVFESDGTTRAKAKDGMQITEQTITITSGAASPSEITISNLKLGTYVVKETASTNTGITLDSEKRVTVVKGQTSVPTAAFTNNYETTSYSATKVWKNGETVATPPADSTVTFQLQSKVGAGDWTDVAGKTIILDGTADGNGETTPWIAQWTNLPKYNNGVEIAYRAVETKVRVGDAAEETLADRIVDESGVITNTLPKTEIGGTKTWNDKNVSHTDPTIKLYRKIGSGARTEVTGVTPTWADDENGNRVYTFSNLDMYDNNGQKYTYEVEEVAVTGYRTEQDGFDFVNTELTEVNGTKTWVDAVTHNNSEDIALKLSRKIDDGEWAEVTSVTPSWTGNNYTYSNLDKYDANGNEYEYKVEETGFRIGTAEYTVESDGYATSTGSAKYKVEYGEDNAITNTELTNLTVDKQWFQPDSDTAISGDNFLPNATITVKLEKSTVSNPVETDWTVVSIGGVAQENIVLGRTENWTKTWSDLPKYEVVEGTPVEISYRVVETEAKVNATDAATITEGSVQFANGQATLTNTLPTTEISGKKIWAMATLPDGNPTLVLKRSDDKYAVIVATGEGESTATALGCAESATNPIQPTWDGTGNTRTYRYSSLPKYDDNGNEYTYEVSEASFVVGDATYTVTKGTDGKYTVSSSSETASKFAFAEERNVTNGKDFTNTELTTVTVEKNWLRNGVSANIGTGATIQLLADEVAVSDTAITNPISLPSGTSNSWTYTWSSLPKYKYDETSKEYVEIVYTVTETSFENGTNEKYDTITYVDRGEDTQKTKVGTVSGNKWIVTFETSDGKLIVNNNQNVKDVEFGKLWKNASSQSVDEWPKESDTYKSLNFTIYRWRATEAYGTGITDDGEFTDTFDLVPPDDLSNTTKVTIKSKEYDVQWRQDETTKVFYFKILGLEKYDNIGKEWFYRIVETEPVVVNGATYLTSYSENGNKYALAGQYVINTANPSYELPSTGGPGTKTLYAAGLSLIALAVIGLFLKKKR